ncbi:MAG: DUF2497 domain-containing protein [Caulobacterales bacterium]|nr:DUF2497 domain-containing protein [Caulobacterales bacterium]
MSDQTQEPTMEEILASIRRIISEDEPAEGAPAAEAAPPPAPEPEVPAVEPEPEPVAAAPEPEPEPEPLPEPEPVVLEEAPLDLTERYEEPAPVVETIGDIEAAPVPDPFPAVEPEPAFVASATTVSDTVVASMAGGTTVEELVRSIVEPQVRTWLDQNLDGLLRDMLREKLNNVFR